MYFHEMMTALHVCFMEGNDLVAKHHRYGDPDKIYDLLKAAHAPLEDHHAVAEALRQGRSKSVILPLSQAQYKQLKFGGK
jgi:hypothetical protein